MSLGFVGMKLFWLLEAESLGFEESRVVVIQTGLGTDPCREFGRGHALSYNEFRSERTPGEIWRLTCFEEGRRRSPWKMVIKATPKTRESVEKLGLGQRQE